MVGLATALAGVKDGQVSVTTADMAVWAAIGTALGAIIRHQVAGVVGGLIWVLVVENMASGLLREAARFTPGQAVHALADVTQASNLPSLQLAAALLGVYLVLGAVLATATLERSDLI